MPDRLKKILLPGLLAGLILTPFLCAGAVFAAQNEKESPLIINGDNVEYSADKKEVVATGNIEVIYKGSKLTCRRLKVNMLTKEGVAEGDARVEDEKGVITGEKIVYNFADKTGVIYNADFRANPYFGKAKQVEKISEEEFVAKKGYFTTCSFDRPHYRIAAKKIKAFPGDKMQAEYTTLYLGPFPLLYLPRFNYSVKEPIMHIQVEPGKSNDWGMYLLTAWRYNLTENTNLKLFLDYRNKLGVAEGFELNYKSAETGNGDFKFYYTDEKSSDDGISNFQRYMVRWRHKWDIDPRTNVVAELHKISDQKRKYESGADFLQDYFFREYEQDAEPLSYFLFHHAFNYSSLDILMQARTNHWFDQVEKLPEINYSLPGVQVGETPLYFENFSQFGTYNKKADTKPETPDDVTMTRLDTTNRVSLPMKAGFVNIRPYLASRQTYYDKGANGDSNIVRTIFYSGADVSTKFYRTFNVKSNFMGMDINGLRHIITPSVGYLYTHEPTIPVSNLHQVDDVDAITRGNTATVSLSNKLQTKRNGQSVDFVDFWITSDYVINPKSGTDENSILYNPGNRLKSQFSDILFKLKVLPYSWLRMESEATFEHSDYTDINYNHFSVANYCFTFDLGKDRSFSIGQRYERKGNNEVTAGLAWRLNPKWKFGIYQRFNFKKSSILDRGFQEQEYTLTRNLHCWDVDISVNKKEGSGTTLFFTFRLKAFPENEFGFDQTMKEQKSGAQ